LKKIFLDLYLMSKNLTYSFLKQELNKRKKSIIESATGKKGKNRASGVTKARRYCQVCGAYNHVTKECWNLPSNAHKRPKYFVAENEEESVGNGGEDNDDGVDIVGGDTDELGQTGTAD
jgi:hypothetical protein